MPQNAGEVARSRTDAERLLTATCTILRPSKAVTGAGYPEDVETVVASDVPGRLVRGNMPPWERSTAGQVRSTETYMLYLRHDQAIAATDIVVLNGRRLEVVGQTGQQTDEVLKQVEMAELR